MDWWTGSGQKERCKQNRHNARPGRPVPLAISDIHRQVKQPTIRALTRSDVCPMRSPARACNGSYAQCSRPGPALSLSSTSIPPASCAPHCLHGIALTNTSLILLSVLTCNTHDLHASLLNVLLDPSPLSRCLRGHSHGYLLCLPLTSLFPRVSRNVLSPLPSGSPSDTCSNPVNSMCSRWIPRLDPGTSKSETLS